MPRILFTRENARDMQARSAAVQELKRSRGAYSFSREDSQLVPDSRARAVVNMLREEIANTRRLLKEELAPKDRAVLLRSLSELVERERVWSQRPGPPIVRQERGRERRLPPTLDIEPTVEPDSQVSPAPVQALACGPDTTTNGVPRQAPEPAEPQSAQQADFQVDAGAGI